MKFNQINLQRQDSSFNTHREATTWTPASCPCVGLCMWCSASSIWSSSSGACVIADTDLENEVKNEIQTIWIWSAAPCSLPTHKPNSSGEAPISALVSRSIRKKAQAKVKASTTLKLLTSSSFNSMQNDLTQLSLLLCASWQQPLVQKGWGSFHADPVPKQDKGATTAVQVYYPESRMTVILINTDKNIRLELNRC